MFKNHCSKNISNSYNPEIDLLKLFFSFSVFFFHFNKVPGFDCIMPRGYLAVEFFFIVSGYFMGMKLRSGKSPETVEFILRKITPIYPIVFAATVIAFIERMIFAGGDSLYKWLISIPQSFFEISMLWMSGINVGRSYNGPTWYISAMLIAMAVIYPLYRKYWKYFSKVGSLLVAIICYSIIFNYSQTICVASKYFGITTLGVIRAIAGLSLGVFLNELCSSANQSICVTRCGNVIFGIIKFLVFIFIVVYMCKGNTFPKINVQKFDYVIIVYMFAFLFLVFSRWGSFTFLNKVTLNLGWCSQIGLYLYLNHRGMTHFLAGAKMDISKVEALAIFLGGTVLSMVLCFCVVHYGSRLIKSISKYIFIPREIRPEDTKS